MGAFNRFVNARGRGYFTAVGILSLLAFLEFYIIPSSASDAAPYVWFIDNKTLNGIDTVTNQITVTTSLSNPAKALVVDPQDRSVWVLHNVDLLKFSETGISLLSIDLRSISTTLDHPMALAFNPYDRSVWVASQNVVFHVSSDGRSLLQWQAPNNVQAIGFDIDESVWVLTKKQLIHLSISGATLGSADLSTYVINPGYLAIDNLADYVWVAAYSSLMRFDLHNLSQPQIVALPSPPGTEMQTIDALAVDPLLGTLWVASRNTLYFYDRAATLIKSADLTSASLGTIQAIAYDPYSFSLWLGGNGGLARFTGSGDFVARWPVATSANAIGVVSFKLLPTMSLNSPSDNSLTNNPRPTIRLGLGASCNGMPCFLADSYIRSLAFDASLNSQAIGSLFTLSGDEAVYTPSSWMPEGLNIFTGTAIDLFGHRSDTLTAHFTIDTIPPHFTVLTPADGSTVTTNAVTISGQVDDPTVSIILFDASGNVLSIASGASFGFAAILQPGQNTFGLIARDPAGNESRVSLRLTYNALSVQVAEPVAGVVIDSDRLLVSGVFHGPPNTGITVNGVVALIVGDQFFANDVPLTPGENMLTIVATTQEGDTISQRLTVTSTGQDPFAVEATPIRATDFLVTVAGNGTPGLGGDGGPALQAQLSSPSSAMVGADGSMYIADADRRIRRVGSDGVMITFAGTTVQSYGGDGGPASQAQLNRPNSLAFGSDGSLYFADTGNSRIRRITADGIITTVAGTGVPGYAGDGGSASQAQLNWPNGISFGADGALYIADTNNHRIRRIGLDGVITTVAGISSRGFSGDGGPATQARLNFPAAVAAAPGGSLYIADSFNFLVRKVDAGGIINTLTGGIYNDLKLAADGYLYGAQNSGHQIRRIDSNGNSTRVAGIGQAGSTNDGPVADTPLNNPKGIALGPQGDLYIADTGSHRIRHLLHTDSSGAPLAYDFRIINTTGLAIQKIEADFNGDGITDATTFNVDASLRHVYTMSGAYPARFVITDSQGNVHELVWTVVVNNLQQMDAMLRGIYTGMVERLRAQDIDGALRSVTGGAQEKYRAIFAALKPNLPIIVDQLGTLQNGAIGEELAEYVMVRNQNGQPRAFLIYFLRGEDGVWRIDGM